MANDSTQYCHIYTPRPLRESTYVLTTNGETFYGMADLEKSGGVEVTGGFHSLFLVGHMMEIQSMVLMDTQIGQVVLSSN